MPDAPRYSIGNLDNNSLAGLFAMEQEHHKSKQERQMLIDHAPSCGSPFVAAVKPIEIDRLSYQTRESIVNVLVEAVFNVESTASQIEIAKSAIVHLLGIGVDVPKTAPNVVPVDIQDGSLGVAAYRAMPVNDWHTREVIKKIPDEHWEKVAQAVIAKYWELSTVPGQPAG